MANSDEYIVGLVFSVFDDWVGPTPKISTPQNLSKELLIEIAGSTLAYELSKEKTIKQLTILPFPSYSYKILYKTLHFDMPSVRGKLGLGSISLIFKEENDSIFYKYIKQFEEVFDSFDQSLIDLEEQSATDEELITWINNLQRQLKNLVKSLRSKELANNSTEETNDVFIYKIIICGDANVGKTSIVLQFTNKAFKREYLATIGVNISNRLVHLEDLNQNLMLNLWDIAGQNKFNQFHQAYYSGASGFVLVVDLTDHQSLDSIRSWYKDIRKINSKIPGILVGNKKDLVELRTVSSEELSQLGQKLKLEVIEVSALTGENINEMLMSFGQSIYLLANKTQ